jgi:14-3-3 protein epsilon
MQLLRDNLTLWTSSDGAEGEAAGEAAPKEEAKPAEEAAKPAEAAATTEEQPPATLDLFRLRQPPSSIPG